MSSVLPLQTTASLVMVRTLLDIKDEHSSECLAKALSLQRHIQHQNTNVILLEAVLKNFVQDFPQLFTIFHLDFLVSKFLQILDLKNCNLILCPNNFDQYLKIISRCKSLHTIVHDNGCESDFTLPPKIAESWGLFFPSLSTVSLEENCAVDDVFIHTLLRSAPNLTSLNISLCPLITDHVFKLPYLREESKKKYNRCKLTTVDLSGCRNLTSTCLRHLTELCGSSLLHINVACTSMECTILWYLSGYNLSSLAHLALRLSESDPAKMQQYSSLQSFLKTYEKLCKEVQQIEDDTTKISQSYSVLCDDAVDLQDSKSSGGICSACNQCSVEVELSERSESMYGYCSGKTSAILELEEYSTGSNSNADLQFVQDSGIVDVSSALKNISLDEDLRVNEQDNAQSEPSSRSENDKIPSKMGSLVVHTISSEGKIVNVIQEDVLEDATDEIILASLLREDFLMEKATTPISNLKEVEITGPADINLQSVCSNCHKKGPFLNQPTSQNENGQKKVLLPRVYEPKLLSLNISNLDFDVTLVKPCFKEFFASNKKLEQIVLPSSVMTDDLLKILADQAEHFTNLNLFDCERVTNDGVSYVLGNCRRLKIFDIQANHFISDEAFLPLVENHKDGAVSILRLTEISVTDRILWRMVHCWGSTLKELNLGWCEEITSDGVLHVANNCPMLETFDIHKIELSHLALLTLAKKCTKIKSLELCDIDTLTDDVLIEMVKTLKNLKNLNISWNLDITDRGVKAVLVCCPLLTNLTLIGLKRITEKPLIPIISDYNRWTRCQAFIKLKMKEKQLRETSDPQLSSDEEYEELYVPVRSTSYAPMLRHLHLEFCDIVNDRTLAEIVAICCGNLTIIDYYGIEVVPRLLSLK